MQYSNPKGDYFCYFLDEEVTLGSLDVPAIRKKYKHLEKPAFAPLYLSGIQVAAVK